MCRETKEQILFNAAFSGLPKGVRYTMFSCVVYKINKGKYKVEHTSDGSLEKGVYYKRIDDLPVDIQSKVKQLMWVPPDDQTMNETIGIRIGENIFWIV